MTVAACKTRLLTIEYLDEEEGDAGRRTKRLYDLTVPPDNCGVFVIQTTEIVRADLLIVQDKSRSMAQGPGNERNPPPGQSKWEQVRTAIEQVVSATTTVDWGLLLFGLDGGCGVPTRPDVPVGPATAATIRRVLDITSPDASTPTTQALHSATAYFATVQDGHPHALLLATDGQPTCVGGPFTQEDADAAVQAVADAARAGINTFVVGIGTMPEAQDALTRMAKEGRVPNTAAGQPAYYPVTGTQDLVKVLQQAALRITPCSYPVEHPPPDPWRVTIQSTEGIIDRDPYHRDGWDFTSDGEEIVFYGDACTMLRNRVVTSVQAIYGCPGE